MDQEQPTNTTTDTDIVTKASKVLSIIFSPLLMPTYSVMLALWITPLCLLKETARLSLALALCFTSCVIPLIAIFVMMRLGKVSNIEISNRRERIIPFIVAILCYLASGLYLRWIHAPQWLCYFFYGAAFAGLTALIVNLKWKISGHCSTYGGYLGILFFIASAHINTIPLLAWLIISIILGGMIGSARIILGAHTPGQVFAGYINGFLWVFGMMWLSTFSLF
jgi:membrane-associated phospholipid phosphatase